MLKQVVYVVTTVRLGVIKCRFTAMELAYERWAELQDGVLHSISVRTFEWFPVLWLQCKPIHSDANDGLSRVWQKKQWTFWQFEQEPDFHLTFHRHRAFLTSASYFKHRWRMTFTEILRTEFVAHKINIKNEITLTVWRSGISNLFWMVTHLTKPPRLRDTPLTVRPPPPPYTRLENKIHNYIIKTNKANLTARFSYLIMSKAEFRLMISDFKILNIQYFNNKFIF
jgi:hypothetical protein